MIVEPFVKSFWLTFTSYDPYPTKNSPTPPHKLLKADYPNLFCSFLVSFSLISGQNLYFFLCFFWDFTVPLRFLGTSFGGSGIVLRLLWPGVLGLFRYLRLLQGFVVMFAFGFGIVLRGRCGWCWSFFGRWQVLSFASYLSLSWAVCPVTSRSRLGLSQPLVILSSFWISSRTLLY